MKKEKAFNMRARRKELGLTLEEVGRRAGLTAAGVRQVEVGANKGSFMTLYKIADALEVPVRLLMSPEQLEVMEKFLLDPKPWAVQMSTKKD